MAENKTRDMTEGKPLKLILQFAIPLLFGNLFQQLYSMVDTIIVGKFLGVDALAAVGATGAITFLIIGFCGGMCDGFALPVAQKFGGKKFDELKKVVGNIVVLVILLAIVVTAFTLFFCGDILRLMNTPEDIIGMSYDYLIIIFAGIPATLLFNVTSGLMKALGNAKIPVYILFFSSAVNIVLDLLFIIVFGMGVSGAAYATILAQAMSGIIGLVYIIRNLELIHIKKTHLKLEWTYVSSLLKMGFPMGFQYTITAVGIVVMQIALNGLGSLAIAASTAAMKVDMITEVVFQALGATMATYCGQNVGARKYDRVKTGLKNSTVIGAIYSLVVGLIFIFAGKYLLLIVINANETEALRLGAEYLLVLGIFYIPLCMVNVFRFTIQGMGFAGFAVIAGIAELIGRSAMSIIFVPYIGFWAICLAGPVAWVLADAFLIPAFFWCMKKLKKG